MKRKVIVVLLAVILIGSGAIVYFWPNEPKAVAGPLAQTASAIATQASASASKPTVHTMGQTVSIRDNSVTARAIRYQQPVAKNAPRPDQIGFTWAALEVEVCILHRDEKTAVSRYPWSLAYADNTQIDPSDIGYQQFPKPELPWEMDRVVPNGKCIRGWITFAVPENAKPISAMYHPEDLYEEWSM